MGDKKSLSKARMELEELYLGIPDDSVNLTFQDLAEVKQNHPDHNNNNNIVFEKKKSNNFTSMEPIQESKTPKQGSPQGKLISLPKKLPSLDFSRGLQAAKTHQYYEHQSQRGHQYHHGHGVAEGMRHPFASSQGGHNRSSYGNNNNHDDTDYYHGHAGGGGHGHGGEFYDDVSAMSMASSMYQERGGRPRRPGIPHSNICTVCSTYIYFFRHRCLVCGRVYCRNCVTIGMGEMTEGRKCVQCLGKRFSQRYIQRAGKVGCWSRYGSGVKQEELKWAEKGPRKSGERGYVRSTVMMSRSTSPITPVRSPNNNNRAFGHGNNSLPNSFVASSPYSPYSSSHHHHLPL